MRHTCLPCDAPTCDAALVEDTRVVNGGTYSNRNRDPLAKLVAGAVDGECVCEGGVCAVGFVGGDAAYDTVVSRRGAVTFHWNDLYWNRAATAGQEGVGDQNGKYG